VADQPGPTYLELMRRIHGTNIYAGFTPNLPEDLQGWNSQHPAFEEIIRNIRPDIVIDVGVWKGASTILLADLLKRYDVRGAVIGIDTFLGNLEHCDRTSSFAGLMQYRFGRPLLYEQFLSNVVRADAHDRIVPLAQTTTIAAILLAKIGVQAGLIHLDASHDYEDVLSDARLYWDILAPGGFLIGDDYNQDWPSVIEAADDFAAEKEVPLINSPPKWIVRKPE
jgi:SAM-dependent methyltransferase